MVSKSLGIKLSNNLDIDYEDTHGGFHGDGDTLAKVEFERKDAEDILVEIKANENWENLPLPNNLKIRLYGGELDGDQVYGYKGDGSIRANKVAYTSYLAERLEMPEIENGYWQFIDRHGDQPMINDDSHIFQRASQNLTFGIYDADTNILYYGEYDS